MKISQKKKDKITEQLLSVLYDSFPESLFTSKLASEIARDEEFVKTLLQEMLKKELVVSITKNKEGTKYQKRMRWRLSNRVHEIYSNAHSYQKPLSLSQ